MRSFRLRLSRSVQGAPYAVPICATRKVTDDPCPDCNAELAHGSLLAALHADISYVHRAVALIKTELNALEFRPKQHIDLLALLLIAGCTQPRNRVEVRNGRQWQSGQPSPLRVDGGSRNILRSNGLRDHKTAHKQESEQTGCCCMGTCMTVGGTGSGAASNDLAKFS
jgi:hypothetical protein